MRIRCVFVIAAASSSWMSCSPDLQLPNGTGSTSSVSVEYLGSIRPPLGKGSLAAFQETVYPLVTTVTCKGCHGATQSPLFAGADSKAAHDQVIASKVVDFDAPENSRLVQQLLDNQHNCWTPAGCEQDAKQMLAAVTQWITLAKESTDTGPERLMTPSVKLDLTTSPTGPWDLTFDLSKHLGGESVNLTIKVEDLDDKSYLVTNPTIITPTSAISVENLTVFINGTEDKQASDYSVIEATATPPETSLSGAAMVVGKGEGPSADEFSIGFIKLDKP